MMPAATKLSVTTGKQWRRVREEGLEVVLPSGNIARVRNVSFDLFLRIGRIPDSLTPIVVAALNGRGLDLPPVETMEDAMKNIDFLDGVARSAFVSPRIVDTPQTDDEIALEDVELEDKLALVGLLGLAARELAPFCQKQNQLMADLDRQSNEPQPPLGSDENWGVEQAVDGTAGGGHLDETPV